MLHRLLLYIHILSAILSIGPVVVLLPLLKKLRVASREAEQAYIQTFKMAVTMAKHAGHVLVISGILLMIQSKWPWTTSWIMMTWLVMVSSLFFLARSFSPTLKKFENSAEDRDDLVNRLRSSTWIYLLLLLIILWMMVAKPTFW